MSLKRLSSIVITMVGSMVFGQAYQPVPEEGAIWIDYSSDATCGPQCFPEAYFSPGEIEIIEGKRYIPIWKRELFPDLTPQNGRATFYGYLRNDSTNRIVYLRKEESESIWCDFSIEYTIGELLDTSDFGVPYYVLSIDSVLIGDNYHRRVNIGDSTTIATSIVDGFGSTARFGYGIVDRGFEWTGNVSFKLCEDSNTTDIRCQLYDKLLGSSDLKPKDQSFINVFPNPTTGIIKIDADLTEIRDISGKLILRTSNRVIDLSHESNGIYFVRAKKGNKVYYSKVVLE